VYIVCTQDAVVRPEWQRHLARDVLGVEPLELAAGHSPMLERPRELAGLLDTLV
jgi:pimeloyl-ACP methyl ester carboxylesterase